MKARFPTDGGTIMDADVIEHEGKLWLVPFWLDNLALGYTTPARIVRFDNRPHQDLRHTDFGCYLINDPLPRALFEAPTPQPPIAGFEYHELPDIRLAIPSPPAKSH